MTKTRKIIYGISLGLAAVLLVLGVFFDKSLSNAMYQPSNVFAKVMESGGIFPPFLFVAAMFTVLFYLVREEDRFSSVKRILTAAGVVLAYVFYGFMATERIFSSLLFRLLTGVGTAAVLSPLTFLVFRGKARSTLKRLAIFLIFASMVSVISALLVNVMKFFWGRPRFREMMYEGDYDLLAFTPWYKINGFSLHGHHSFPSGHTASAANLLALCALPEVFSEAEGHHKTVAFVVAIYIFAMAYSRIVLGAHFLSDVTGGFLIGFITYAIARYLYFDKSRIVVDALIEVNRAEIESHASSESESAVGASEDAAERGESPVLSERVEVTLEEEDDKED